MRACNLPFPGIYSPRTSSPSQFPLRTFPLPTSADAGYSPSNPAISLSVWTADSMEQKSRPASHAFADYFTQLYSSNDSKPIKTIKTRNKTKQTKRYFATITWVNGRGNVRIEGIIVWGKMRIVWMFFVGDWTHIFSLPLSETTSICHILQSQTLSSFRRH